MKVKKVALLGAGGIGSYFIWGLSELLGEDFCIVAEGERAQRLKRDGITINGKQYILNVKSPQEAAGCDLLVVAVKHYSLEDAVPSVKKMVTPNTIVISLLNGIDSEEVLIKAIGEEHLLYSTIRFSVQYRNGEASFKPELAEGLFFGERDTAEKTDKVLLLERFLAKTPIKYQAVGNIVSMQWKKYMINISGNLPQAIFNVGYGAYFDSEHLAEIRIRLQQEVAQVAKAWGIDIDLPDPHKAVFHQTARFSTLQDLDAKRHTEIDMLLGVLIEKAKAKGIEVPFSEFTYYAIKVLEEKNDGKFDYSESCS